MSLFQYIAQACQTLAATVAPSITAMGVHIVLALATIMMVWFGVQEALASAHGGPGFSMGRFLNLFMLLTFAYVMVNYYDSSIPGLGFSIKSFIDGGTTSLVNLIGADGSTQGKHACLSRCQSRRHDYVPRVWRETLHQYGPAWGRYWWQNLKRPMSCLRRNISSYL